MPQNTTDVDKWFDTIEMALQRAMGRLALSKLSPQLLEALNALGELKKSYKKPVSTPTSASIDPEKALEELVKDLIPLNLGITHVEARCEPEIKEEGKPAYYPTITGKLTVRCFANSEEVWVGTLRVKAPLKRHLSKKGQVLYYDKEAAQCTEVFILDI